MRQISILSFTQRGAALNRNLVLLYQRLYPGETVQGYTYEKYPFPGLTPFAQLSALLPSLLKRSGLLVFIGAAGIAMRAVAPYLEGKDRDPAVLVADELGKHVISLLSGHLGGANEHCLRLAEYLQAEPVITTATDLTGTFAVDLFAVQNSLVVSEPGKIKSISGRLLNGEKVGFFSRMPVSGRLPEGLVRTESGEAAARSGLEAGICLSYDPSERPFPDTCHLLPRDLAVGVGCRTGKTQEELEAFLHQTFQDYGLEEKRICGFYSIEEKRLEPGLWGLAGRYGVPFIAYTKEELAGVGGSFAFSAFVERTVGIGNVCERSAVLGSRNGILTLPKQASEGMTLAAACRKCSVCF